jgi:spermidine synthase
MRRTSVTLFSLGFGSTLSQILLLREFLVSFYGNELSIGIIFACWLVWIGCGSAFGNRMFKHQQLLSRLSLILLTLTPLVTILQIFAVKFVRVFLHTTNGEFLSLLDLFGFSFVVLSAGCFLWGLLFALGAMSFTRDKNELWIGVNKAYILESFGSVVGGILFSFFLAEYFSTLQIIALMVLVTWSMVAWMAFSEKKWVLIPCVAAAILFLVVFQSIRSFEQKINALQWFFINPQLTFAGSLDTKYQNLSLLRLENQYTVYADGRPAYIIPNQYDAELLTHVIMIHRTDAKRVLVLGGGFNGVVRELLKYRVEEVEYVEIDPALLPFVKPVMTLQDQQALLDQRVHVLNVDGRELLRRNQSFFDVILMNVGEPSTASVNRFYTEEFFHQCYRSLNEGGIFAFSFPSSTEYLADELKDFNASLYQTFTCVFTNAIMVPGTHAILIGTKSAVPLISQPDSLARRYAAAGISSTYFSKYMFDELMPPDRVSFITHTLESTIPVRLNTDNNPTAYYYDLLLWNKFLQGSNGPLIYITRFRIFVAVAICSGLILLLLIVRRKKPTKQKHRALAVIMALCGMTGMALNLLFLLNFQETFGSIFELVGALIAANMLGLALGALMSLHGFRNYNQRNLLLVVLGVLMSVALLLPQILEFLLLKHFMPMTLVVTIVTGGLIGMSFGFVNRLYLLDSTHGGSVYAFDVFGSAVGALFTCSLLLPVLGIRDVSFFLTLLLVLAVVAVLFLRTQERE